MKNNITKEDLNFVIEYLQNDDPKLTQGSNVYEFEKKWSEWLGVKYSVFVNSGSSANLITLAVLKELYGEGEIIVPALTWVSDIASVIQNGFTPVFVDITPQNLCMNEIEVIKKTTSKTKAVFMTHAQGFNGLSDNLIEFLNQKSIPLIEDVCESHGAQFKDNKLGSYGLFSNFSFYYAHHMSTIEGGMICTNDEKIYQMLRMFRSHGMVREATNELLIQKYKKEYPSLNSEFIFAYPAYNLRNTEIGAIIGKNQLKYLDRNIEKRNKNHAIFLKNIDKSKYRTDFILEGSSNYALNLIFKEADDNLANKLMKKMDFSQIEYRRGSAGGGNQMRQPYLKKFVKQNEWLNFPETEHIHFYGFYLGNYPDLNDDQILELCSIINDI